MRAIDDFLFDKFPGFQPIGEWLQVRFGIDCFAMTKVFAVSYAATGITHTALLEGGMGGKAFMTIVKISLTFSLFSMADYGRSSSRRGSFVNPYRGMTPWMVIRAMWFTVALVQMVWIILGPLTPEYSFKVTDLLSSVEVMSIFVAEYFVSCTPLPPAAVNARREQKLAYSM